MGIDPGASKRDQVVKKFGDPSKVLQVDGTEMLAYVGPKAIQGTDQAMFRIDPATQVVLRIEVFPQPVIDKDLIESSFGRPCPASASARRQPCYVKRLSEDFKTYFHYASAGLAVFFNKDGKTVQSFVFTPAVAEPPPPAENEGKAEASSDDSNDNPPPKSHKRKTRRSSTRTQDP